jgi:asparagine synthase (glutamine-hydrolysing)
MCGIAGILNLLSKNCVSEDVILRMISILNHRGPEESGVYFDHDIHMGHSRLSIIGLEKGTQPIFNQDESLCIVYNGEVFNYIELRSMLEKKGYKFTTQTDTEVILHLYEEKGPACLSELNVNLQSPSGIFKKKNFFLPETEWAFVRYITLFKMADSCLHRK